MNRRQFLKAVAYGAAGLALPRYASPQQQDSLVKILGDTTVQYIKSRGYKATHILQDTNHRLYILIEALKPETTIDLGRGVTMDFVMQRDKVNRLFVGTENTQEYPIVEFQRGLKGLDNPRLIFEEGGGEYRLVLNPNVINKNSEGSYTEPKQQPAKEKSQKQKNTKTPLRLIWALNPSGLNVDK